MKKQLYEQEIVIDDHFSFIYNKEKQDCVDIYQDHVLIETFALNRKIYTFFKVLQDIIQAPDYIIVEETQTKVYGKEIYLYDNVYFKVSADHACLSVDFYDKAEPQKIVFLTKMIYTTQRLFFYFCIPKKMQEIPKYYITYVFHFLDYLELMSYEKRELDQTSTGEIKC